MTKVVGVFQLQQRLNKVTAAITKDAAQDCIVGFTQNYAFVVHERVGAKFTTPGTQAKYLEQPAKTRAQDIADIVTKYFKKTRKLSQSLFIGGLFLQSVSVPITPLRTGALRGSAFTRLVNKGDT